ncbi:histone H4-like TAF Taf6, SAGA complex subunit [Malassezia psittaci]|uniref:TBP-associated factor 6 n=1 Tax=Malassezia psittaci TaxID=1821823 RepID=A0AAF0F6L4_9BASI|nr:histone H4-like TAF Taf6, SAGA complex subunit [Malassezia psittaci]
MSPNGGAKRMNAGGQFGNAGGSNAPVFGPSIPSSVYPKDSVKDVAESLGIVNLRDNIATALATDIEYRIRDIAQSAAKYMKHAKRSQMTTTDVDNALRQKNVEPLYGMFPPFNSGKTRGPWFRSVETQSNTPLYMIEDEEVDFDTVLEAGPRVGVGRGVGWHAHWLAIEGVQPPVPENPVFLARQSAANESGMPDAGEAVAELGSTTVKPLVKHVLSRELQLYYERLTSSIINPPSDAENGETKSPVEDVANAKLDDYGHGSTGNTVRDAALASLRGDAGIHQLVPYLVQWVGANVTHVLRARHTDSDTQERGDTMHALHTMLDTLHALLVNPSIFIEPYLHQLMPSVLSVLLAVYTLQQERVDDFETASIALRLYAATLLAYIIDHFADSYPTLKPRVVATLLQALFARIDDGTAVEASDASGSLDAKLGALIALRRLGPASFKTLLGNVRVLPPLESEKTQDADRVPLRDLGNWVQDVPKQDRSGFLSQCLVDQVRKGLQELGNVADGVPVVPEPETLEQLEEIYGKYWTQEVLQDDAAALTALSQYKPLAGHD